MRPLPRAHAPASVLVPALAAAAWWGVMALVADEPAATQRSLVFIGGPLLLLAGLHARLFAFLHAPDRLRWLPTPIVAARHWQAGARTHLPELLVSLILGVAALLAARLTGPSPAGIGLPGNLGLAVEFAWLGLFALALEPLISAVAAVLGRRFPEDSRANEMQRGLGGGWTTPEAVVHLYAPAFGVGLATLLAMPGQLSWERWLDTGELGAGALAISVTPLLLAFGLRSFAPRLYARGMWEAVPWLAEATRTLAGPPRPEPTPGWLRAIPDPWTRLLVTQFLRATPLPQLRLVLVLGLAIVLALRDAAPTGPAIALAFAVVGAWLVPARELRRQRRVRARLAGALPISRSRRAGRAGPAALLLWLPPTILFAVILSRAISGQI